MQVRVASGASQRLFTLRAVLCGLILAASSGASAQSASDFTFAMHGYVVGSLYAQDGLIGPSNGQQAWYAALEPTKHRWLFGGDVRTSRFNFSVAGPKVVGGTPRGVLEFDWSNNNGPGSYGDVSLIPRLRLAFAELNWGTFALRVGQDHELVLGSSPWNAPHVPVSVGHLGYPLSYQAGEVGWREPQAAIYFNMPMGDFSTEFALQVLRSQWRAPINVVSTLGPAPGGNGGAGGTSVSPTAVAPEWTNPYTSEGEYSGLPAVEARVQVASKVLRFYVAGHWGQVHRAGINVEAGQTPTSTTGGPTDLDVVLGEAGVRVVLAPVVVQGGVYAGRNLAPFVGNLVQFQPAGGGDVHEWGAWGQAGFNFTPEWSVWGFAGTSNPNDDDIRSLLPVSAPGTVLRLQNVTTAAMLRWSQGGYSIGLEWLHFYTKTTAATRPNLDANQYMFSGAYLF
jgi:hypothetical protein